MAKSPEQMRAAMIANLKDNTGKTLPQWLAVVKKSGEEKHGQIIKHLKAKHGLTHGFANLIAHEARSAGAAPVAADDLVGAQYAGAKADLKPIYDKLIKAIGRFGKDVEVSPKKTYVSLRRSKQFALIKAATKTRVDVGISLKGAKATKRLKAAKGMVSHNVSVTAVKEVDKELIAWLKSAYESA